MAWAPFQKYYNLGHTYEISLEVSLNLPKLRLFLKYAPNLDYFYSRSTYILKTFQNLFLSSSKD